MLDDTRPGEIVLRHATVTRTLSKPAGTQRSWSPTYWRCTGMYAVRHVNSSRALRQPRQV